MTAKNYKALIIDDETLARKAIISLLKEYPNINIVAEADCVPQAIQMIEQHSPDLLFLDIQMPGKSGFELLNQIVFDGQIIFITAYDEYAMRAFEINALDYLLKPVSPERLAKSLERLNEVHPTINTNDQILDYNDRLFILMGRHMTFLKISKIVFIRAEGDYSMVYTTDNKSGLILKSMKEWENRLPQTFFCRIHRSSIINLEYVEKIEKEYNYDFSVFMHGFAEPITMSRRYARSLKEKMG